MSTHTFVCQSSVKHRKRIYRPGDILELDDSHPLDAAMLSAKPDYLKGKTGPKPKEKVAKVKKAKAVKE